MITDDGLRLATAEALNLQNAGDASPAASIGGVIGDDSATLALDEDGLTPALRIARDIGAGQRLDLAIQCTVSPITAGGHDSTMEIQLISMPILASVLDAGTTEGQLHSIAGVATDVTGGVAEDVMTDPGLVAHGLATGTPVFLSALATTTVLAVDRIYYVIVVDADTISVATTLANAVAGTQVEFGVGDGTCTLNFLPTVHASTGTIRLFDEIGTSVHGGQLVLGSSIIVPVRPITVRTDTMHAAPTGQTLRRAYGVGPNALEVGATPQRFYYLNYKTSVDITAGAFTVDLVPAGSADNAFTFMPVGTEVIG